MNNFDTQTVTGHAVGERSAGASEPMRPDWMKR